MSQAAYRAATVAFLEEYRASAGIFLQVWPGRPNKIATPVAFPEAIRESYAYPGMTLIQRTPQVDVLVLHGYFDSKDIVAKRDAFCDGFLNWTITRYHQAGANTLISIASMEDDPDYSVTWTQEEPRGYYSTRITLEGYSEQT